MKRLLLLAPLLLAGCAAVGPNYRVPSTAAINTPAAQGTFAEAGPQAAPEALPARWWHLYSDPVLDTLETEALAANTDLRAAAANLAHAASATAAAQGAKEPDFGASAGVQHARLSGESYLLSEQLPVLNLGAANVEMSYQLDLFGRVRRNVEAAKADEAASEATLGALRVTLAAQVARAYLAQCAAAQALDLARQQVAVQQSTLDSAQKLAAAGRLPQTDVTRMETRLAQAQAMLGPQQARSRAALYQLAYLLGRAPADYPRAAESCHAIPTLAQPLPVGDGAALLRRRPDVRAAERHLAAATARIGVATADLYPQIGFGLSGGTVGKLADLGMAATNAWSLGSLVRWNFPGAGQRARVRAAHADADAALARFDGTVLAALRETETALAAYAQDHDRLAALARATLATQTSATQAHSLRMAGKAALLSDLGEQQSVVTARMNEQAAREAVAMDQITLFLALGGGWEKP
jgi:NodT family efflux transporter outer membrane factor (OMF) lipoprotein